MPTVGERRNTTKFADSYANDPLNEFAQHYLDTVQSLLKENGTDIFMHPAETLLVDSEPLKNFFINESCVKENMTLREYEDHVNNMEALFENDKEAVLEHAPASDFNPVIGMTFPLHKNILMNAVFDNGVISKYVANSPKFTLSMETRKLVTPAGEELDLWKDQMKLTAAINQTAPVVQVPIALPENEYTNILADVFHATNIYDNLSIDTYISGVMVKSIVSEGETFIKYTPPVMNGGVVTTAAKFEEAVATAADTTDAQYVWRDVNGMFTPYYGEYDRAIMYAVNVDTIVTAADASTGAPAVHGKVVDVLSGYMRKNKFMIQSTGNVVAVRMAARIDTSSAMLQTCSVTWGVKTDPIEIGDSIPINVPISPNEVKDIGALYNTNQMTKIMSMINIVLKNYKDDMIHEELDKSFLRLPESQKIARCFDFAPRQGYYDTHLSWRYETFMEALDDYVSCLMQYLNDPNMTVTVVGRASLIRKMTPTEYDYKTPSNIGPVKLDFVKYVKTSNDLVYQFVSTDKMRGNDNLIIILNPRNTDRILYRIYDYQMYVSNEIRNPVQYTLPAIHAYERWKFVEYQPVQGRIKILNPSGLREHFENTDPIGKNAMNDLAVTP